MAELATIARPYAEALFQVAQKGDLEAVAAQLGELAQIAAEPRLREFSDNPKVTTEQVFGVVSGVVTTPLNEQVRNFLRVLLDNGRLNVLPEIVVQFVTLKNSRAGVLDATVESPFPLDATALAELNAVLERRFGRKLNPMVKLAPELIGGIRVTVGDEVLDTSVRARLEQMKVALLA
jgi:F-type H+-transporting ATPase subunit delta